MNGRNWHRTVGHDAILTAGKRSLNFAIASINSDCRIADLLSALQTFIPGTKSVEPKFLLFYQNEQNTSLVPAATAEKALLLSFDTDMLSR